jgi:hypothetical protein
MYAALMISAINVMTDAAACSIANFRFHHACLNQQHIYSVFTKVTLQRSMRSMCAHTSTKIYAGFSILPLVLLLLVTSDMTRLPLPAIVVLGLPICASVAVKATRCRKRNFA